MIDLHAEIVVAPQERQVRGIRLVSYRLLVLALFLTFSAYVDAQISPGPLAKPHAQLNGATNCMQCHQVSTRAPSFKCVDCHREIVDEIQRNHGLHATFPRQGPPGATCVKCHSDHNGVDFQMIHWNPTPQGFNHAATGFPLEGKHAGVTCRACHAVQHIAASERALLSAKDLNHTWMGLSSQCATCHADAHQGRFGGDCAHCHSTSDWKAAVIDKAGFDHSKTGYPLTGAHRGVKCESCHTPSNSQLRFTGLKFSSCSDCHRDPHNGAFNQTCASCHTTLTWKRSQFAESFDHSKTTFPLLGKHVEVSCVDCHEHGDFKKPIKHDRCADCHTPDPHAGQFAHRADGGKCEGCHTVQGWRPSTFSVADHAKTGFPLVSPHAGVKCADCHTPAGTATKYKIRFSSCVDCHKDEHAGQFAGDPWHNRCEQCHNGATFQTTSYTLAKHQKSGFPLAGGHMAVACNECHKPMASTRTAAYHFAQRSCTTCHEDVHKGQFAVRMAALDSLGKPVGCEACHSTNGWEDLSKFDHSQTNFPLLGAHRAVGCAECHRRPTAGATVKNVDFANTPTHCGDCHQNPHANQFGVRASDCSSCHNTNQWRPSLFDHDKTLFPLKGAHENVACSACHTLKKVVGGNLILFYKPTPTACEACHSTGVAKSAKATSQVHQKYLPGRIFDAFLPLSGVS